LRVSVGSIASDTSEGKEGKRGKASQFEGLSDSKIFANYFEK